MRTKPAKDMHPGDCTTHRRILDGPRMVQVNGGPHPRPVYAVFITEDLGDGAREEIAWVEQFPVPILDEAN